MTSQIAVFNLECVAVASDSVLTVGNGRTERTLSSSEKMFDLGPAHRVVALTSGEARFMRVPWSVLLDQWISTLTEPKETIADYGADLVQWLAGRHDLFPPKAQEDFFGWQVHDFYLAVRRQILRELDDRGLQNEPWDDLDVQHAVDEVVAGAIDRMRRQPDLDDIDLTANAMAVTSRQDVIQASFDDVFGVVPRTVASDELLLLHLPALILGKHEAFDSDSVVGLVGYGANDLFPGHQVIEFHGVFDGLVRRRSWRPAGVTPEGSSSMITPLAQTDAIETFLRAYHDDVLDQAHRTLDVVLDDLLPEDEPVDEAPNEPDTGDTDPDTVEDEVEEPPTRRQRMHMQLNDDFDHLAWRRFVSPMLATVDALPRVDMARMAEALVGIQALRAASMGTQPTVGGPIDVAVISRANGVQWLRRKELTLN